MALRLGFPNSCQPPAYHPRSEKTHCVSGYKRKDPWDFNDGEHCPGQTEKSRKEGKIPEINDSPERGEQGFARPGASCRCIFVERRSRSPGSENDDDQRSA